MTERDPLLCEESGVAFLEFLVAFIPVWVFFLSIVQLALIATASLIVQHAADSAARAAVVVFPDDPRKYQGTDEMLDAVRKAALAPLTPVAPTGLGAGSTIAGAIDTVSPASSLYSEAALSLSFPAPKDGPKGKELRVRVTYAYACRVPIARRILCSGLLERAMPSSLGADFGFLARQSPGSRFLRLEHEATLLIHGAAYDYDPTGGRS